MYNVHRQAAAGEVIYVYTRVVAAHTHLYRLYL